MGLSAAPSPSCLLVVGSVFTYYFASVIQFVCAAMQWLTCMLSFLAENGTEGLQWKPGEFITRLLHTAVQSVVAVCCKQLCTGQCST